jgi:hypothetical protein
MHVKGTIGTLATYVLIARAHSGGGEGGEAKLWGNLNAQFSLHSENRAEHFELVESLMPVQGLAAARGVKVQRDPMMLASYRGSLPIYRGLGWL